MNRNFTKEEAERIFSLAAEKQQTRRIEDMNQLSLEDLEEAGAAAGIDPAFIREAASDLLRPDRITEERSFMGFPVELRESHVFPIPFTDENWKKLVDVFVHAYGKPGITREIGTTKRWSSEEDQNQMPANIIAEQEGNGTRITIERKMWPMTMGLGISSVINALMGVIFTTLSFTVGDVEELIIPGSIMLGIGLLLGLGGTLGMKIYSKSEKKRFAEVFRHAENLSASIDTLPEAVQNENIETSGRIALDDLEEVSVSTQSKSARTRQKS